MMKSTSIATFKNRSSAHFCYKSGIPSDFLLQTNLEDIELNCLISSLLAIESIWLHNVDIGLFIQSNIFVKKYSVLKMASIKNNGLQGIIGATSLYFIGWAKNLSKNQTILYTSTPCKVRYKCLYSPSQQNVFLIILGRLCKVLMGFIGQWSTLKTYT